MGQRPLLDRPVIVDTLEVDEPDATGLRAEMLENFNTATCPAEMLAKLEVPPREPILGDWFKQGDLGFIYGQRGLACNAMPGRECSPGPAHQVRGSSPSGGSATVQFCPSIR